MYIYYYNFIIINLHTMAKGVATEGIIPAWLQLAYLRVPMNGSTCLTLPRPPTRSSMLAISTGAEEEEEEERTGNAPTINAARIETKKKRDDSIIVYKTHIYINDQNRFITI